jgi:septum site-determining protein MinC
MTDERITIRGTRDGIAVTIGAGDWPELMADLEIHLQPKAAFFRGARVLMNVGARSLTATELAQAKQILEQFQMNLAAVHAADSSALAAMPAAPQRTAAEQQDDEPSLPYVEGILLRRTLRAGQVARCEGHVAIIGDVNAGAEVIAGGDVIVWGKVRGIIHAGALGDENAVVCALYLAPMQLRIGSRIARAPEGKGAKPRAPEMAYVRDGAIIAEPWATRGL